MNKTEILTEFNFWKSYLNARSSGPISIQLATEYAEAYAWGLAQPDLTVLPADPDELRAAWIAAVNPKLPAEVFVDGVSVGNTMYRLQCEKGESYDIVLKKDGKNTSANKITASADGELLIDVDDEGKAVLLERDEEDLTLKPIAITPANVKSLLTTPPVK